MPDPSEFVAKVAIGNPIALTQFGCPRLTAGEIGIGPDGVVLTEVAFVLEFVGHGGSQRRITDMLGQRPQIAGEHQIEVGLGQGVMHPVDDGLQRWNFGKAQVPVGRQDLFFG